jgi:flagellar motor switch protein FliG
VIYMAATDSIKTGISGPARAAVVLMLLGEQGAAEVLKHMSPREIQMIGEAMATIDNVPREIVSAILADFCEVVEIQTEIGIGKEEYLCSILNTALGDDKAKNLIDRILGGRDLKGLDAVKWMEPRAVADMVRLEHPQIIAILLSYLEQEHAAEVLAALPENMQADIVMRIASLDGIQPRAMQELNEMLEKHITGDSDNTTSVTLGGLKTAAGIMRLLDSMLEAEIIARIGEVDCNMSSALQELMFVFENLIDMDDRSIQALLREISSETLIIALTGADATIREKIFQNMSRRAVEMLRDDLESRGPVKLSEIKAAQKEILTVARGMADIGVILPN